jgi:hypothetical protein
MITDLPTPDEYDRSGVNLFNMAWAAATSPVHKLEELVDGMGLSGAGLDQAVEHYWRGVQPQLANALSLTHQAMEVSIKGRIAAVSPYLLIANQPKDYPKDSDKTDVSFTELRTVDAIDLIRLHNTVAPVKLGSDFAVLFEKSRRERNKFIHGGKAHTTIKPLDVAQRVVEAFAALNPDLRWPAVRMEYLDNDEHWGFGFSAEFSVVNVLHEFDDVIQLAKKGWVERYLGFAKNKRRYHCPKCYFAADSHEREFLPRLAQLSGAGDFLKCFICSAVTPVDRQDCVGSECKGNVMRPVERDHWCTTCGNSQADLVRWE